MIKRVYLEITNSCNLDCPFCQNSKGSSFMNLDDIKNYLKQIKEVCDYVYLHVLGEPLLHKDIDKIFEYADSLDLNIQLVTNGTLLNNHLDILNHPSLRKLSISIHSINSLDIDDSYFKTIDKLIENSNDKYIELRFYDSLNLNDKLKKYLNHLFEKYNIQSTAKLCSYKLKDNVYIYYQDMFKWPNIDDEIISYTGKCRGAIDQLAILNDGRVTICCLDSNGYNTIGDLKEKKLIDIINSDDYKEVISNFKNNKLSFDLCKRCSYRLRFK